MMTLFQNSHFVSWRHPHKPLADSKGTLRFVEQGKASRVVVSMMEPNPGFLLLASDLRPLYVNPEATQILAYPDTQQSIGPLDSFLLRKIRAVFFANGNNGQFASEFLSGRRRYLCRAYWLSPPSNNAIDHPALAVLLERSSPTSFDAS